MTDAEWGVQFTGAHWVDAVPEDIARDEVTRSAPLGAILVRREHPQDGWAQVIEPPTMSPAEQATTALLARAAAAIDPAAFAYETDRDLPPWVRAARMAALGRARNLHAAGLLTDTARPVLDGPVEARR